MLTRSGLDNDCDSCRKSNRAWTKQASAEGDICHALLALFLALVFWLSLTSVAGAASGPPWHSETDGLSGEVLVTWQLWVQALEAEAWTQDDQSWVPSSLPWLISAHPTTPNAALAAGSMGLHRTVDGGMTWSQLPGIVAPVIAVAYKAGNPQIVFAGTELNGNYRSEDGGVYWHRINAGLPRDQLGNVAGAVALATDPALPNTLFAATASAGGVYRSQDEGTTWHLANSGLPEETVFSIAISESGSPALYAATPSGLYRSSDRAGAWSLIGTLPIETSLRLLLEPGALGFLLLVAEDSIYRSTNGGLTWIDLDLPADMPPIRDAVLVSGAEFSYLFVVSANGPHWLRLTPASPQSPPQTESDTASYIDVTGHTIREPFLSFFNSRGGVARFGYPRTDAISEGGSTVQYFQRARLEITEEEAGERVVQSQLGRARSAGVDLAVASTQSDSNGTQTQYAVDQVFANFYANNNGREAFGVPIAPAADEAQINGAILYTQYFEFARLEHHPGAAAPILLGLIGDEYLLQKGWLE